jgi:hypothetical protein
LPFNDTGVISLLASVPKEKHTESWWLVLRDGAPISGSGGGGVALLKEIQVTRSIGCLLAVLRLSPFIDALDRRFAVWRRWLSQFVPEGSAPRRYP